MSLIALIKDAEWAALMLPDVITPEAASERDENGSVPLSWACQECAPLEVLVKLMHAYPAAVSTKGWAGKLPLHFAVASNSPLAVIATLLAHYPQGAQERDKLKGDLPLHIAANKTASFEVISALIAAYPEGALEKNDHGKIAVNLEFPLHHACRFAAPTEHILGLLRAQPELACSSNHEGDLPLHLAASNKATSLQVIEALLEAHPAGVKEGDSSYTKTACGKLPLDLALRNRSSLEVLARLLEAYPTAAMVRSADRCLPLHLAARYGAPLALVKLLLAIYPQGAKVESDNGLPLSYAFHKNASHDVLLTLLLADMPLALQGVDERVDDGGSWLQIMDHPNATVDQVTFLVKSVFDKWPDRAQQLAQLEDDKGRKAISICHSDVRDLMNTYLLFLGKYELQQGAPVHKSATAIVRYALDHSVKPCRRVALKFMKVKDQFERENSSRANSQLDASFVLDVIHSYNGDELGPEYARGLTSLGLDEYRYCIALPAADRGLDDILRHDHVAARDFSAIRNYATQIARALEHVHSKSRIHGDLKPLNIVRVGEHIKLIDFDASALIETEHAASKWSSAYLPPELLAQDGSVKQGQVLAHTSLDMWSFGCVLFQLCAGEPLWLANDEDNITDQENLLLLCEWSSGSTKAKKLAKIMDKNARNLVSQLLNKEPSRRPVRMAHVLAHPFFTGRTVGRMPGEEAAFDVFLSYRVDSDLQYAELLHDLLSAKGLRVWFDKKSLQPGVSWEAGFCTGLVKSRCFVPLLSRAAIKSRFESLTQDSRCDNVLLEHRLAVELADRGLLERTYPVLIGDVDNTSGSPIHGDYFGQGCYPSSPSMANVVVNAVEEKLAAHLESQGLGLALRDDGMSVKDVVDAICINQGGFVRGSQGAYLLMTAQAEVIVEMVRHLDVSDDASLSSPLQEALHRAEVSEAARIAVVQELELLKLELSQRR